MKIPLFTILTILVACFQFNAAEAQHNLGRFDRLDPRFDLLVPSDAVLEKIAEGFKWVEGPVWDPYRQY
jgi:gluconolactonase